MVVLITGSSHTGKTLLAQALLNKYRYPYLSIDLLKMGLIRSGNTNLTPADDCLVVSKNYIKQHFSDIKNSCRATIFCASARSAGRRILIKRPRAGDGADGQFFIDCAPQSIKNTQM